MVNILILGCIKYKPDFLEILTMLNVSPTLSYIYLLGITAILSKIMHKIKLNNCIDIGIFSLSVLLRTVLCFW